MNRPCLSSRPRAQESRCATRGSWTKPRRSSEGVMPPWPNAAPRGAPHRLGTAWRGGRLRDAGVVTSCGRRCLDASPGDVRLRAALKSCEEKEHVDRRSSVAFASKMFARGLAGDLYPDAPAAGGRGDERFSEAKRRAMEERMERTGSVGGESGGLEEGNQAGQGEQDFDGENGASDDTSFEAAARRIRHEQGEKDALEQERLVREEEARGKDVEEGPVADKWAKMDQLDDDAMQVSVGEDRSLEVV